MGYTTKEQKTPAVVYLIGLATAAAAGLLGLQGDGNLTTGLDAMFASEIEVNVFDGPLALVLVRATLLSRNCLLRWTYAYFLVQDVAQNPLLHRFPCVRFRSACFLAPTHAIV